MKKLLGLLLGAASIFTFTACGAGKAKETLKTKRPKNDNENKIPPKKKVQWAC